MERGTQEDRKTEFVREELIKLRQNQNNKNNSQSQQRKVLLIVSVGGIKMCSLDGKVRNSLLSCALKKNNQPRAWADFTQYYLLEGKKEK